MFAENLITLLMLLAAGGGSDLLDLIPTRVYWEAKEVQPTVQTLLPELRAAPAADVAKSVDDLGSADAAVRDAAAERIRAGGPAVIPQLQAVADSDEVPVAVARAAGTLIDDIRTTAKPREVRRLMAIRTLGEMKDAAAAAALKPLLTSKEPFVASYAARAIAQIEGKPLPARAVPREAMKQDLALLPAATAAVGQIAVGPGMTQDFATAIAGMEALNDNDKARRLVLMGKTVIELADRLGNVRIDGLSFGVSGDLSDKGGHVVIIARGEYDPEAASVVARQEGLVAKTAGEYVLFETGPDTAFFFPSGDRLVVMASPAGAAMPTAAITAAVRAGKGTLADAKDLTKLVAAADTAKPVWAVGKLTPALQALPYLGGLETLKIDGNQEGDALRVRLSAAGTDAARVKASADEATRDVQAALTEIRPMAGFMPPLRPLLGLLESVKVQADGPNLSGSAAYKGSLSALFVFGAQPYTTPVDPEELKKRKRP